MVTKIDLQAYQKAIDNWESTAPAKLLLDMNALREHMLSVNGITFGAFFSQPKVVDEKKYVMFLLKYG
jgi:hypothetical protein